MAAWPWSPSSPPPLLQLHCCHQVLMCVQVPLTFSLSSSWGLPRSPAHSLVCPPRVPRTFCSGRSSVKIPATYRQGNHRTHMERCLEDHLISPVLLMSRLGPRRACEVADAWGWKPGFLIDTRGSCSHAKVTGHLAFSQSVPLG